MRNVFISALLILSFSLNAQNPEGIWVLAYLKANQPILTATMEQGELVFDEGAPADSSEVYTPGLMLIAFESAQAAQSYSWDGNENWKVKLLGDSIQMFGKRDTLSGSFSPGKMVLSSSIDAVPTEYTFLKVDEELNLINTKPGQLAELEIDDHPFDGASLNFEQDTVYANDSSIPGLELYLTTIGPLQVIEYSFDRENNKVEFGIIYLFADRKRILKGLLFPVVDDFRRPKSLELKINVK